MKISLETEGLETVKVEQRNLSCKIMVTYSQFKVLLECQREHA